MLDFIKKLFNPPERPWDSNKYGRPFTQEQEQKTWEKGKVMPGQSEDETRQDVCGAIIKRNDYGNTSSHYGWEIDHIRPISQKGRDDIDNLQPLQWRNNRSKGDDYPVDTESFCRVREKLIYHK